MFHTYGDSFHSYNLHFPFIHSFHHYIFYGGHGVGKYSQMLNLIYSFTHSAFKFDNKIISNFDKQSFFFNISDLHFEVDMGLLGCNSKLLWHEIFILDFVKSPKMSND